MMCEIAAAMPTRFQYTRSLIPKRLNQVSRWYKPNTRKTGIKSPASIKNMPVYDFMALFMVTMKHSYINPPELTKPTGYTHVVQSISGRTVYVSGQIAFDKDGKVVGAGDFRTQAIHVFENLKSALAAAGATYEHVVKVTTFVTD